MRLRSTVRQRSPVLASNAGKPNASAVFEGAREGDNRYLAAVSQMAAFLGIGLANVITLFGSDRIVVGGGIAEAGDLVLRPIEDAVKRRVTLVPTEDIEIVPAHFGRFAGAVGAAIAGVLRPSLPIDLAREQTVSLSDTCTREHADVAPVTTIDLSARRIDTVVQQGCLLRAHGG